jgi:hypothetical protein
MAMSRNSGLSVRKPVNGQQQHRLGAEIVDRKDPIVEGRPLEGANQRQSHDDEDGKGCQAIVHTKNNGTES